jgi:hypothetical protein
MSGMPLLMLWLRRETRLRWPALLAFGLAAFLAGLVLAGPLLREE